MDVLNRDRSPVCGQQSANAVANSTSSGGGNLVSGNNTGSNGQNSNQTTQRALESSIQRNLTNFSLITHGFGTPAIMASLNVVRSYLNESMKIIDRQMPSLANIGLSSQANQQQQQLQQQQQQHLQHHHHHHHHQMSAHHQAQHLSSNGLLTTDNNTTNHILHHHSSHHQAYHQSLVEPKKEII